MNPLPIDALKSLVFWLPLIKKDSKIHTLRKKHVVSINDADLSSFGNLDEGQELGHLQKELTDVSSYLRRPFLFRNNNLARGDSALATCEYTRECTHLLTKNKHR